MRKLFILTTLLFGLLIIGCSDNNGSSQAGNGGGDGNANFEGNNPALSITTSYAGGMTVNFQATLFNVALDSSYSYLWEFGEDNAQATVSNPSYTYKTTGEKTVKLTVRDSKGIAIGSTTATVKISDSGIIMGADFKINKDPNDVLTYIFESPVYLSDGVPVEITWNFDDGEPIKGTNNQTHRFSKYNKTYNVQMTAKHPINGKFETTKPIAVTTYKPIFSIQCSTSGLSVTCNPVIAGMPEGFEDAHYVWNFGGVQRTTNGNESATYTFDGPGSKEISVRGTSSQVEGEFTAETQVSFSNQISLDAINCTSTGTLLEYVCSVNAVLASGAPSQNLTYDWTFDDKAPTSTSGNTATYAFAKFPPLNNPSYVVNVTVGFASESKEKASTSKSITISHPTVSISKGTSTSSTSANFNAILSQTISGATYRWIINGPNNFYKQVEGVNQVNSGEIVMPYEGRYTVDLTVSHGSFAQPITAQQFDVNISANVEGAEIICNQTDGMKYTCTTNARGYTTVDNGQQQEVELEYSWTIKRGDGQEGPYTSTSRTFTQQLLKYSGTYYVDLTLKPKGSDKLVTAPQKEIRTAHATMSITKPATIRKNTQATFSIEYGNLVNNIQPQNTDITWTIDDQVQSSKNQSITHTFTTGGTHKISARVNASNFGAELTATTTVDVLETTVTDQHVSDINLECTTSDPELNGIRKQCTVSILMTPKATEDGVTVDQVEAHLIPIGVRGNPDSQTIVAKSGQTVDVIFDWPWVNVAEISDKNATRTFTAYLRRHVYSEGKKIKELSHKEYTINFPKVSYELEHTANDASNIIGTGATIRLQAAQDPYNSDPSMNWEWYMNFNGAGGRADKSFGIGVGQTYNFKDQMVSARFSGSVKGNPFNVESGFGLKLSGSRISKPLYLYGTNTQQGLRDLPNALGNFLGGRGLMIPEGTMMWEGQAFRDVNGHGFKASFVVRVDPAYNTQGWDLYCVIGTIGYKNNARWLYTLPPAQIVSGHPTQRDRFHALVGAYYGETERRDRYVAQKGQPKLPAEAGTTYKFELPNYYYNFAEFGLRGVHVGYASTGTNLEGCLELKKYDYNSSTAGGWYSDDIYNAYQ